MVDYEVMFIILCGTILSPATSPAMSDTGFGAVTRLMGGLGLDPDAGPGASARLERRRFFQHWLAD